MTTRQQVLYSDFLENPLVQTQGQLSKLCVNLTTMMTRNARAVEKAIYVLGTSYYHMYNRERCL